jgi:hypothetical protein
LEGDAETSERRVALGFPQKIPLKAGFKPALQLFRPAPKFAKPLNSRDTGNKKGILADAFFEYQLRVCSGHANARHRSSIW